MKKFLSVLLCAALLFGGLLGASAAEGDIIYGDVDEYLGITSSDARLVLRYSVGLDTMTDDQILAADVDGGGTVDASDARKILRASVGLEDSSKFGVNGSQVFMSGNFVMVATIDEEAGTQFTVSQTADSTYMEASMDFGAAEGGASSIVRVGFLTIDEDVYWVLPDAQPRCYLLIDEKVTANMGIDAEMFKELMPQMMTPQTGKTPDEQTVVTVNGKTYNRWIYENDDGTYVAHDMRGITLQFIRTFDAEGNETSCMRINSVQPNVPEYQRSLPRGSMLFKAEPGDDEGDIGYILAFMMRFAELANIPMDDLQNGLN